MNTTPTNVACRGTAAGLICCAIVVAFLNLYMNFLASRTRSSFQLDLSADGDVFGFHQFEFPADSTVPSGNRRRHRGDRPPRPAATSKFIRRRSNHRDRHLVSDPPCMGLCPTTTDHSTNVFTQIDYVKTLIDARMKNLPKNTFRVEMTTEHTEDNAAKAVAVVDVNQRRAWLNTSYLSGFWRQVDTWITPRRIEAPNDTCHERLINALLNSRIIRVSTPTKGTQLKAMVLLDGGQWAVWKPKFLERADVVQGGPTDGPDRHNGEIAAFYIGKLFGLNRTPFVVGRVLNVRSELRDFADAPLKGTFFNHNQTNRLCFYGRCLFCTRSLPVCANEQDRLEGALVLWFPPAFANLTRLRSPWARTYDPNHRDRLADWQMNANYCRSAAVLDHGVFGKPPVFLDLMETAVFDFLISNADRHRLEFFKDHSPASPLLLLDNGKSFGDPNTDEITILAPLYQCCRLRRRVYDLILRYSEINFGALLNDRYLKRDPLYPILTSAHLEAINRRLRKVLVVVASCIDQHGDHVVLVDDGY